MKRGFTLLELLIVIIIVGIMATLGLTQYSAVVERSRGAEARQILGQLRRVCAALYMNENNVSMCSDTNLGLGDGTNGTIPGSVCAGSHYFRYTQTQTVPNSIVLLGTRCTTGGKLPQITGSRTLALTADYGTGTATWTSPNGY